MRIGAFTICTLTVLLAGPTAGAEAQRPPRPAARAFILAQPGPSLGVRGGHDFDVDAWSVGAQARVPVVRRLELVPSADLYLGAAPIDWQVNADAAIRLGRLGGLYAGGGLAVLRRDDDDDGQASTDVAPNLLAGVRLPGLRLPVRPFVEARWTFAEADRPFRLAAGIDIPLARRPTRPARRGR